MDTVKNTGRILKETFDFTIENAKRSRKRINTTIEKPMQDKGFIRERSRVFLILLSLFLIFLGFLAFFIRIIPFKT